MLCCLFLGGIESHGITEISGESAVHVVLFISSGIVSRGITEVSGGSAVHVVLFISRWYSIPRYH